MVHVLKCWPEYFRAVKSGEKNFELRRNDRGYNVGDVLELHEWDPTDGAFTAYYTGQVIKREVSYVLDMGSFPSKDNPTLSGYVVMGLKDLETARLRAELDAAQKRAEAAERDLTAAVRYQKVCETCLFYKGGFCIENSGGRLCGVYRKWQWRGPDAGGEGKEKT